MTVKCTCSVFLPRAIYIHVYIWPDLVLVTKLMKSAVFKHMRGSMKDCKVLKCLIPVILYVFMLLLRSETISSGIRNYTNDVGSITREKFPRWKSNSESSAWRTISQSLNNRTKAPLRLHYLQIEGRGKPRKKG